MSERTRREFLASAAGVAGAAALAGASGGVISFDRPLEVRRAAPRVPLRAGEPIRMGVIGTGGMGTGHCDAIASLAEKGRETVVIVALADVCDPRVEHAKGVCERRQKSTVETYRDYKKLLARDDIHCVLIASPEHWHAQMAIDAIEAGKDVYCEKPMTLDLADAVALRKVIKANPEMVLQVGTQMMQLPKYQEAKRLIASGLIGVPTFSQTSYCRNSKDGEWLYYAIDPAWKPGVNLDWEAWCGPLGAAPWSAEIYARWRRYKKYSTGIIGDLLVHQMTPLMMATDCGWPIRVVATGSHLVDKKMENFDQVNLLVEFESGHMMTVAGSTCNELGLENIIRGHKGNVYLGGRHCVVRPERLYANEVEEQTVECPDIGNDQDLHRLNWLKCVRTREQPLADVELGTKVMVVVDLAARSMWERKSFSFDPGSLVARAV